jgi:hypothetical protein
MKSMVAMTWFEPATLTPPGSHRHYPRQMHRRGTRAIVKAKVTQSIVANMQPAAQHIIVVDTTLPRFVLRIRPTGTKISSTDGASANCCRIGAHSH